MAFGGKRTVLPYAHDPVAYAREVLGEVWWTKQELIARSLLTPPYRTLVKACHKVGKTHLGGGLVNWWYDSFDPGLVLTTAPTDRQVRDLLWKEVRMQRRGRSGFTGPKSPRLESSPDHFAYGFTAKDGDSFQGHHSPHTLFIFDEAVGVASVFWETAESMFNEGGAWLAIFNPTDTSSQAYAEELSGGWHVISMSVLEHPNILAELQGFPPPFPSAIRLSRVDTLLKKWCRALSPEEPKRATDILWRDAWYRPGPIAEARLLGRWPSQATNNVWSDGAFQVAESLILPTNDEPCELGCDVARYGDDYTEIHVRRGGHSLYHEAANGWSTVETAGRLKQLANEYGRLCGVDGRAIAVKIDDDGIGGGVVDLADGYTFLGVSGARTAYDPEKYPNRRSELWFSVADRAMEQRLSFVALDAETRRELRRQAMAPTWKQDSQGRRVVEPKADTKKRIKRSPDGMDAVNLAYAPAPIVSFGPTLW
ncbi:hypothetical protein SE18_24785 [Herpetosiphon geysericola]|uniref:Terminase n=1 Tax=Herpetosiphon geysericola TaxID=70996 RepID=A0A0P6XCR7_9CHLR|nr:hypothetical protein SE18_24785 [Herpetosiphon geysericola]